MCSPTIALSAATSAAGALGQYQQGKAQSQIARLNAQRADQQAREAQRLGAAQAYNTMLEGRQLLAQQRTAFAANGVNIATGSPLDVSYDTAGQIAYNAAQQRANAGREANQYYTQAEQLRQQATYYRQSGRNAAVSTLLTGSIRTASPYLEQGDWLNRLF